MSSAIVPKCQSFSAFYRFYLGEHRNLACRLPHLVGSSPALNFRRRKIRY